MFNFGFLKCRLLKTEPKIMRNQIINLKLKTAPAGDIAQIYSAYSNIIEVYVDTVYILACRYMLTYIYMLT